MGGILGPLILTVGLPRSGKSTWARKSGCPVVNPDSIRLALHGHVFLKKAEPHVWAIAHTMVEALLLTGHDAVILDATNISPHRRAEWQSPLWTCKYVCFPTSKEECIRRALDPDDFRDDLVPIIERMAKDLVWPTAEVLEQVLGGEGGIGRLWYLEDLPKDHIGEQGE